jgi:hypothetical protein
VDKPIKHFKHKKEKPGFFTGLTREKIIFDEYYLIRQIMEKPEMYAGRIKHPVIYGFSGKSDIREV